MNLFPLLNINYMIATLQQSRMNLLRGFQSRRSIPYGMRQCTSARMLMIEWCSLPSSRWNKCASKKPIHWYIVDILCTILSSSHILPLWLMNSYIWELESMVYISAYINELVLLADLFHRELDGLHHSIINILALLHIVAFKIKLISYCLLGLSPQVYLKT